MKLNSFLQGLPTFPFDTDYRTGIYIEELAFSDIDGKEELIELTLNCTNRKLINEFMRCGNLYNYIGSNQAEERAYSYVYDWGLIYSAFLEQYGIDLIETKMHYWKFKALFNNLHDTNFNKVMQIRQMELGKIKNVEERAFYQELKDYYKLPNNKEDKLLKEFNAMFD